MKILNSRAFAFLALALLTPACGGSGSPGTPRTISAGPSGNVGVAPAGWGIRTTTDGAGGAFIVWSGIGTTAGPESDIWIQKLDAAGLPQWPGEGRSLPVIGHQGEPEIVSDGSGGLFVVWLDARGFALDHLYVQYLDAEGKPLWQSGGVPVCLMDVHFHSYRVTRDGAGGILVSWLDRRAAALNQGTVYAQRVDSSGNVLWAVNGIPLTGSLHEQLLWDLVSDGTGGAILAWSDSLSPLLYEQRVNGSGVLQWGGSGRKVVTGAGFQNFGGLIAVGGGALLVWSDGRPAHPGEIWIYAQRVDLNGDSLWTADGLPVAGAGASLGLAASDGAGGAIVAWTSYSGAVTTGTLYAQRINGSGAAQWSAGGVLLCDAPDVQRPEQIVPDGSGGAQFLWSDFRSLTDYDLYTARISAGGILQGSSSGIPVAIAPFDQEQPRAVFVQGGRLIVAWSDWRQFPGLATVFYQPFDANGVAVPALPNPPPPAPWYATNHPVELMDAYEGHSLLCPDGSGGAYVLWIGLEIPNSTYFVQHLDGNGVPLWSLGGVQVCPTVQVQADPQMITDGAGGVIVVWLDGDSSDLDIIGQRIDSNGSLLWSAAGIPLVFHPSRKETNPRLLSDGAQGCFLTWWDDRAGAFSPATLAMQRFDGNGAPVWAGETVLSTNARSERSLVADGSGGLVACWIDGRNGNLDLYAQRVASTGSQQWTAGGVPVATDPGQEWLGAAAPDGTGGVIVGYSLQNGTGQHAYSQRLDSSGQQVWTSGGQPLQTPGTPSMGPWVVTDGAGGGFFVWSNYRSGAYHLFAQRLNSAGVAQWAADGISVAPGTDQQDLGCLLPDGSGGMIVAWAQNQPYGFNLLAQRIAGDATLLWTPTVGVTVSAAAQRQFYPMGISDGSGGAILVWDDLRRRTHHVLYSQRVPGGGLP